MTGTIALDGTVGPVGGVVQKTAAVQGGRHRAVPRARPRSTRWPRAHAGKKLKVVRVATLDDALAALGEQGGDLSALGPKPSGAAG